MTDKNSTTQKRGSDLESLLHSEHIITVEKMAVGGSAVARIAVADKSVVVFIPYGAPNDELKIKISAVEKNFLNGEIIEIIKAGSGRRTAACEYFGRCGGCLWQHIDESEQVLQKELILKDLFKKFLPAVEYNLLPTVSTPEKLGYRNRIQLKQMGQKIGYFKHESHDIVEINNCLISETALQNYIPTFKTKLRPSEKLKKFEIKINQTGGVEHYPVGEFGEGLAFSQVNRFVNQRLVETVTGLAQKLNPENPRAKMLEAQGIFYTPEAFGGGKQKALPLIKEALAKFDAFKPSSDIMPNWGLFIVKYMATEAEK